MSKFILAEVKTGAKQGGGCNVAAEDAIPVSPVGLVNREEIVPGMGCLEQAFGLWEVKVYFHVGNERPVNQGVERVTILPGRFRSDEVAQVFRSVTAGHRAKERMLRDLGMHVEDFGDCLFNQGRRLHGSRLLLADGVGDDHVVKVRVEKNSQHDHRDGGDDQVGDGQLGLDAQALI